MVRMRGLEPPRLATPEPKSGTSTNSVTSASVERHLAGDFRDLNPSSCISLQKVIQTAWTQMLPCPIERRFRSQNANHGAGFSSNLPTRPATRNNQYGKR